MNNRVIRMVLDELLTVVPAQQRVVLDEKLDHALCSVFFLHIHVHFLDLVMLAA
jgi:hypothetical protein